MPDEYEKGDAALGQLLATDEALLALIAEPPAEIPGPSIFYDSVPDEVKPEAAPIIIIRHLPPREDDDFITISGYVIWTRGRFELVANGVTENYGDISPAAGRCDDLLHRANVPFDGGEVVYIKRLGSPIRRTYLEGDKKYKEAGRRYEWAIRIP